MKSERGVVLVQVLTMAIVLGSIAMMLIQWQFGRYVAAYRVETSRRARDVLEAALNQQLAVLVPLPGGQTSASPTTVTVKDPAFGTCQVTVTNACTAPYTFCAYFDPCVNCTPNPCL